MDPGQFSRYFLDMPVPDIMGFVVIHRIYKRPHYRLFHMATTYYLGVLSILNFYQREP
jgi:hypothetical protein